MTFTRMTVVGTTHRCEMVVASDEILGAVLPRMLDLLHEGAGPVTRPLRLVLPTGDQLDVGRTPADQHLLDGAVVRLVRAEEVPPPPEVADVTDVLGDEFGARTDLWSARSRTITGSVALAAVGAAGTGLLPATTTQRLLAIATVLILTVLAARLPGPTGRAAVGALTGLALGIAAVTALRMALAPGVTATGWVLPVATALGLLGWACAGGAIGIGLGHRPALAGSGLGLLAVCVPLAASAWARSGQRRSAPRPPWSPAACFPGTRPWPPG